MRTSPVPRLGQRARARKELVSKINQQAHAIVTVEQRRQQTEARLKQLEDAVEWAANLTFWQRLRWLVLGK